MEQKYQLEVCEVSCYPVNRQQTPIDICFCHWTREKFIAHSPSRKKTQKENDLTYVLRGTRFLKGKKVIVSSLSRVKKTARDTARDIAKEANLTEQLGGQGCRENSIGSGGAHVPLPTLRSHLKGLVAPKEPKSFPPREPPLKCKRLSSRHKNNRYPKGCPDTLPA